MSVTKPGGRRRALVREVNPHLICVLCSGYFIEATTIVECLHTFCRSCLVKYLENSKFCPKCDVQLHKNNPLLSVRCDPTLQQLVYKLIPGLYSNEMARRRKYYSELGGPTSDPDCGVFPIGDQYFSPDDSISLSLEFINGTKDEDSGSDSEEIAQEKQGVMNNVHHRRYLQCPAAVTMSHLKKFLRMKYCLSPDHNVDIIYGGEVLTDDFSLMDVAYTFSWNKTTPMRFKFRLLQRYSVPIPESPAAIYVEIREPTPPPTLEAETELPPSMQPPPPVLPPKEPSPKVQFKTLTVQVQKLPNILTEPIMNKSETIKPNKVAVEPTVVIGNNSNNNNNNSNKNNNNNNNYSPPKVKPLARHKPGPKSKTEGKSKVEIKSVVKTSPEKISMHLKRNLSAEDHSKETNETSKVKDEHYEPEKKKSKQVNNESSIKNANPPQIEPFKVNKVEKCYDEPKEEKKKKKKEEVEDKTDYVDDIYEIGKWHMEDKKKVEDKREKDLEKKQLEENKKIEETRIQTEKNNMKEEMKEEVKKLSENKMLSEEKRNSDEKKHTPEKRSKEENRRNEEKKNVEENGNVNEDLHAEEKKHFKEKSYIEKMQIDDDEDRLRILTPPVEEMVVEEKVPEMPAPPPPVAEVQPIMRSEERRKEKKKNKKAKHHHHHRHHDRKRDSPPAATILHSSENDIMKLKIKLTEVNSKVPKYSVVDGNSDDRKEPKENGHSHKSSEKYIEKEKEKYKEKEKQSEKIKAKDEEPKLIAEIINNKNDYNSNSRVESVTKEKLQPTIRQRPKITQKPIVTPKQNTIAKQDVANVKPMMQSPPMKIQSPPPRQSPSPKSAPPKAIPISKPIQTPSTTATTKLTNGTLEPLKMPPSTITVSKITAEEKRQMEQQKLLMGRNNNNGLDSKRPSLEIMLVNAPKKAETLIAAAAQQLNEAKPIEVKKVIRPTPPSIPLSRLAKGVGFGAKGSPPPLANILAKANNSNNNNNNNCHDESGALDLSGKSSRKSPDIDTIAMRNLVTLSDTAVQVRNGLMPGENIINTMNTATSNNTTMNNINNNSSNNIVTSQLKIPMPSLTKPVYQTQLHNNNARTIKPGPNQTVRQIPNPSALMFRQHAINGGRSLPPPGVPLSSLRKIDSMTRNLEKVTANLTVKAAVEAAAYASK